MCFFSISPKKVFNYEEEKMILIRILSSVALMLIISISSFAQSLSGSLTLNPYPSPYVSDWENNPSALGSLTIYNNLGRALQIRIRAQVSMQGRGQVFNSITNPIDISSAPVQIITNTTLISLSDASFADKDYERKMRFTGRLLEGYYTACLTVENLNGVILANNICSNFTILYPSAPQLIFPVNNDSLESNTNYPTFQWIPVIVPPAYQIKYTLRIVEILQGQTQDQAINSNIPLYENSQILINSFTYPIEALPIEEGKKYAWQVQALDQFGIPPTQNQGRSEIFTFVKKKKFSFPIFLFTNVLLSAPANNLTINSKKPEFKWIYTPAQGINVKYNIRVAPVLFQQTSNEQAINNEPVYNQNVNSSTNSFIPINDINFINDKEYVWQVTVLNANTNAVLNKSIVWKFKYKYSLQVVVGGGFIFPAWCTLSGILKYKHSDRTNGRTTLPPLANKTIKLVVKYVMDVKSTSAVIPKSGGASVEDPKGSLVLPYNAATKYGNDADKVLDVKTTDANGNFKFSFINPDSMGLIKTNVEVTTNNLIYTGDVYRVARILVDDFYFLSPDNDIYIQPYENKNIGSLTSHLRSYTLQVTVKATQDEKYKGNQFLEGKLDQMVVYILRKSRPFNLPNDEGMPAPPSPETKFGYEVIAKSTTNQFGVIDFKKLILNLNPTDKYYYYAESSENASHTYKTGLLSFKFDYTSGSAGNEYTTGANGSIEHKDPYKTYGGISFIPKDNAIFNSEYKHPTVTRNFYAMPLLPEIKGRIVRGDEPGKGISGASVKLVKVGPIKLEQEKSTNPNGNFSFSYLNVEYSQNPPYNIIGPLRLLWISAAGFKFNVISIQGKGANGSLTMGQRLSLGDQTLDPAAIVHGFISDEDGNGIYAKIKIGESPEQTVNPKWLFQPFPKPPIPKPGEFEFPVAKLNNQKMVVAPMYDMASYIIDTTYVNIDKNKKDLGTIKIYRKLHRMKFTVLEETAGKPSNQWPVVQGAKVKVEMLGSFLEGTTNNAGVAEFKFSNDAKFFKIIVEAPAGKYYEKRVGSVYNAPSKYPQDYTFSLKKATFISGQVFVADNKPVNAADVWVEFGNADLNIFATTNSNGEYLLRNVPINKTVRVFASKNSVDSTIIGDSLHVFTGKLGLGATGKNLYLKIYNGMDITKLLGFPVLLTDLIEENNEVKISGAVKQFKKNSYFSVYDSTSAKLNFHDVTVKPGTKLNSKGVPYAELSNPPLVFNDPNMDMKLYNKFLAKVGDIQNGVQLDELQQGIGAVKGKAFVDASQFDTKGSLSNFSGLYLSIPKTTQNKMNVPTITADGNNPANLPKGFNVVEGNGSGINFSINKFNAESDPDQSFINQDTVRLKTILHTDIKSAVPSDLKLNIGDVVFHQNGIDPINSDKEFSFTLDKWQLLSRKWFFNKGYLTITEGTLKTGADIPIKSLSVTPTTFQSPDFDFNSMLVSGAAPLSIIGNVNFDHNDIQNYWYISVGKKQGQDHAAYFKNLPGMETNALMKINNFEINSKGTFFSLTPVMGQMVKLYKVGILKLGGAGALMAYDSYMYVPGLTFNIPKVTQSTGVEYYKGSNNNIAFRMKPIGINTDAGNGVYIQFGVDEAQQNSQVLDQNGFRSRGVVGEDGKFELNTWLFHKTDSTSILVETPGTPFTTTNQFQTLKIGPAKTYLEKVTGGMKVYSNNWNNFHFEGDLAGTKGVTDENKRLAFKVVGEIKADNQKISLKDVDTPFGGMTWTYEFENSRLIGTMDIHQDLGGIKIDGTSEMLIDGSGWYFLGGGTMQVPGVGPGYAAVLFGDYPSLTQSVKEKFASASYKKSLPNSFQSNISGFLFSGAMSVPVIVPHIGFDLKIVSAEFGVDAGGDIKIYKGFDEGGSTYGLSALAFIHAFMKMNTITCTKLSADAVVELGFDGNYQTGSKTFNLDGCGGFGLGAHLTQKLWGCDFDGCGCMGTIFDEGFDFSIKALMHLDSSGNKSFTFAKGKCSDN